jgi:hypothetical protein
MKGIAIALGAMIIASAAEGSLTPFASSPGLIGLGAFEGSMEWEYAGTGRKGTLTVTLENTSVTELGGYLTAFGFNVVDGLHLKFQRNMSENISRRWRMVRRIEADPLGTLDFGMSLTRRFRGHGDPAEGLASGMLRTFTFTVRGPQALLQEVGSSDFLDESGGQRAFIAHYRGFSDGSTDLVAAALPAPGALPLLAMGLGAARRRRAR